MTELSKYNTVTVTWQTKGMASFDDIMNMLWSLSIITLFAQNLEDLVHKTHAFSRGSLYTHLNSELSVKRRIYVGGQRGEGRGRGGRGRGKREGEGERGEILRLTIIIRLNYPVTNPTSPSRLL